MAERGLQADLAALLADDDEPEAGEQLDLGVFDDFVSPVAEQASARGVAIRRAGRPKGSKTRTNLDVVKLIKATKRPTLLGIKELADLTLDEFITWSGIGDRKDAFDRWWKVQELSAAYEEGRPAARVELTGKGGAALPIAIFGDIPVRPDLVDGNPPDDARLINVTDWSASNIDMETGQGSPPKAHDDGESQSGPDDTA